MLHGMLWVARRLAWQLQQRCHLVRTGDVYRMVCICSLAEACSLECVACAWTLTLNKGSHVVARVGVGRHQHSLGEQDGGPGQHTSVNSNGSTVHYMVHTHAVLATLG
jgi:hypothetical protein